MAVLSVILVGGLVWIGTATSQADELTDAKARLVALQGEASKANEEYNQTQAKLDAAQARLTQISDEMDLQREKVEVLRAQVAVLTLQQFQDRGTSSTMALFTSPNQQAVVERLIMTNMVADTTTALFQNYILSQSELDNLLREQKATIASIEADRARLKDLKDKAAKKVQEAESLVNRLTAAQQAALSNANAAAYAGGNSSSKVHNPPPPVKNGAAAQAIVNWAMARVGYPYVYGGSGPRGYDCSGFTMSAYSSVGIKLPHGAGGQFNYGRAVSKSDLQPGDLVFFYSGPGHVGIYVGGGMIVDARNERVGVVYTSINAGMPFVGARRLL